MTSKHQGMKRQGNKENGTPRKGSKTKQYRRTIETRSAKKRNSIPQVLGDNINTNDDHEENTRYCNLTDSPPRQNQVIHLDDTPPAPPDPKTTPNQDQDDTEEDFAPRDLDKTLTSVDNAASSNSGARTSDSSSSSSSSSSGSSSTSSKSETSTDTTTLMAKCKVTFKDTTKPNTKPAPKPKQPPKKAKTPQGYLARGQRLLAEWEKVTTITGSNNKRFLGPSNRAKY